jgi:hypothetical protein
MYGRSGPRPSLQNAHRIACCGKGSRREAVLGHPVPGDALPETYELGNIVCGGLAIQNWVRNTLVNRIRQTGHTAAPGWHHLQLQCVFDGTVYVTINSSEFGIGALIIDADVLVEWRGAVVQVKSQLAQ